MNTPFQTAISAFPNVKGKAHSTTLEKWLQSTVNPITAAEMERVKLILQIRNEPDEDQQKELKKKLPAITPGALFPSGSGHANTDPHTATSWMQFDIDLKENPGLVTGEILRDVVAKIKYVAFAGLSTRGQGVWGLVNVANLERRTDHFIQLQADFKAKGIILDPTKGANPNDLRFYSFDPNAFIRTDFKPYDRLPAAKNFHRQPIPLLTTSDVEAKIAAAVDEIYRRRVDITEGYQNWFEIGCSLAKELGENGRDYFHRLSMFNSGYRERTADRQYSDCLRQHGYRYSAGTFFHHCRMNGITPTPYVPLIPRPIQRQAPVQIDKGYPPDWDSVKVQPGTWEYFDSERHAIQDSETPEPAAIEELRRFEWVIELFKLEPAA
jgi:hypothetical protein